MTITVGDVKEWAGGADLWNLRRRRLAAADWADAVWRAKWLAHRANLAEHYVHEEADAANAQVKVWMLRRKA